MKKPCDCRTRPAPPQVEQVFGLVPALAPMPEQASQVTETGISICAVLPPKAYLERDFHVVAQVGAALAAAAATAALSGHAEQIFENVGEGGGESRAETGGAAAALLEGGMTVTVIGCALVLIFQDLVGLVDFLELDFAGVVPGIAVGVKLHRQLAERRFQDGIVGTAFDFEGFVVAALGGRGHDELGLSNRDSNRSETTSPRDDISAPPPYGRGQHGDSFSIAAGN
ncbi:hypothetical protein ACVWWG_003091 [Bradyrhizobium sp. LB7.2]